MGDLTFTDIADLLVEKAASLAAEEYILDELSRYFGQMDQSERDAHHELAGAFYMEAAYCEHILHGGRP